MKFKYFLFIGSLYGYMDDFNQVKSSIQSAFPVKFLDVEYTFKE